MSLMSQHGTTNILTPRMKDFAPQRAWTQRFMWWLFGIVLVLSDLLLTGIGFRLAFQIRKDSLNSNAFSDLFPTIFADIPAELFGLFSELFHETFILVIIPLWLLIFGITGLYNPQNLLGGLKEYSLVFRATTVGMLAVVIAGFIAPTPILDQWWLFLAWGFASIFVACGRFFSRRFAYLLRSRGAFMVPAIIIGANREGRLIAEQLKSLRSGFRVIGFVDNRIRSNADKVNLPIMGKLEHLDRLITKYNIEEIILCTSAFSRDEVLKIFKRYGVMNGINLRIASGLFEIITTGVEIKEVAGVPLTRINRARLTGGDQILKMLLDYAITLPGIILASPIFLLLGLAVKLDSPGPIIYRRRVVGVNGRTFDAFKFRTMYVNGDEILAQHPKLQKQLAEEHKLKYDPRITRVGHILRKFSLDELPQLLNVLKQDMSLVGPRMIAPQEIAKYDHWDVNLMTVKPGITGLWQVSGRSDVSYDERVRLDMYYVRNWSLGLDLNILLRTIPVVLFGYGAY